MKRFIFDSILDEKNICNLEKGKHKIMKGVESGLKLLVYGKRNTGKTSLIKNVIAKSWLRHQSSGFFMYMDERFKQEGYRISYGNAVYLQDKMSRMPEAINRLCFALDSGSQWHPKEA